MDGPFYQSKTYLYLFEILIGCLAIIPVLIGSGNAKNEILYQDSNPMANVQPQTDAQFLVSAVELSMMEMQLGELAQKKASSSTISELGKKLEDDQSASCKQIVTLAKQKLVELPMITTKKAQQAYDKLNEKSNTRFDKAYCSMMISENKNAIALFEEASANVTDPEIKEWAQSMLPVLKSHLDLALKCQEKNKVTNHFVIK